MARSREENHPPIHLDVDWLVGKRVDPRHRIDSRSCENGSEQAPPYLGIGLGILIAAGMLFAWPALSNQWLKHHLVNIQGGGEPSRDESLAIMVALNDQPEGAFHAGGSLPPIEEVPLSTVIPTSNHTIDPSKPVSKESILTPAIPPALELANVTLVSSMTNKGPLADEDSRYATQPMQQDSVTKARPVVSLDRSQTERVEIPLRLEQQTIETLLAMLATSQEHVLRQVCDELLRRSMPANYLELAIDIARGTPQEQLVLLERVVRTEGVSPLPILSWMAQTQDRTVRHRAISLIGAMQDPEAARQLRSLYQREPDRQLQEVIQQALVADRSYSNRISR